MLLLIVVVLEIVEVLQFLWTFWFQSLEKVLCYCVCPCLFMLFRISKLHKHQRLILVLLASMILVVVELVGNLAMTPSFISCLSSTLQTKRYQHLNSTPVISNSHPADKKRLNWFVLQPDINTRVASPQADDSRSWELMTVGCFQNANGSRCHQLVI